MQLNLLFEEQDWDNSAWKCYCPGSENVLIAFV